MAKKVVENPYLEILGEDEVTLEMQLILIDDANDSSP